MSMKLKDLVKYVESENKFNEFMGNGNYKEVNFIKIDDFAFKDDEFTSVKKLVKEINDNYYADINGDIELVNNDGYIQMTFEQSIPDYRNGKFEYKKENYTLNLYLDTKQVWE